MVCLLASATEFQGSKVSEAWDGEAFVAPGKGGPGELEKTLFLGLRTPYPGGTRCAERVPGRELQGGERIIHGRQKQP